MAASKTTVEDVVEVILRHVDLETARKIAVDLAKVKGNTSFMATVDMVKVALLRREP